MPGIGVFPAGGRASRPGDPQSGFRFRFRFRFRFKSFASSRSEALADQDSDRQTCAPLLAQRRHWLDAGRAPRRDPARGQRDGEEQDRDRGECQRVRRADAEELAGQESREEERPDDANEEAEGGCCAGLAKMTSPSSRPCSKNADSKRPPETRSPAAQAGLLVVQRERVPKRSAPRCGQSINAAMPCRGAPAASAKLPPVSRGEISAR